jgi:A/G-specific adenine glycosylase
MWPEDTRELLRWQRASGRHFPWRTCTDPYRIAITELMLVRTRASQVSRVWEKFFRTFPDPRTLAEAADSDVVRSLRGLGLTWRARKIKDLAKFLVEGGSASHAAPGSPGLGPYVSDAVRVAVHGRGRLPIDVTLARLLTRYYGLEVRGEPRRSASVHAAAARMGTRSRRFFHALLDVAALVCLPRSPDCPRCPIRSGCAYARGSALRLAKTSSSSP